MATDGPTPTPCDPEIFKNGEAILAIDGASNAVESWVKELAKAANAKLDWHYSGGVAQVLHLGDKESRRRVEQAVARLEPRLKGSILRRYAAGEEGLYRAGVTDAPPGAVASYMVDDGNAAYLIDPKSED